jgi:acetyl esterase/lipase
MSGALLFTYAALATILTINALRRPAPADARLPPLWLPAMVASELAPAWIAMRLVVAAVLVATGATENGVGRAGLALLGFSVVLHACVLLRDARAVRRLDPPPTAPVPSTFRERLLGRPVPLPDGVVVERGVPYHGELTLDVTRRPGTTHAPAFVYVHGGSWTGGAPDTASAVITHHLAGLGWVVLGIRYPLSPAATFPDHLIGVKRALAWAKDEGRRYGIDPSRVVVAGASAGAHLASLAALTSDDPAYRSELGDADTSVTACVSLYGVYDFFNRHRHRPDWPVIPRAVMKARPEEDPDRYRAASPIDLVRGNAPPFLVVHGTHDSLVPPIEGRHFAEALRAAGAPVELLEVPGAQHGFDAVSSPRSRAVAGRVAEFLAPLTDVH